MRTLAVASLACVIAGISAAAGTTVARADDMDVALSRLRVAPGAPGASASCTATGGNGQPRDFCPDNVAWARLMTELSAVTLSTLPTVAHTTGYGGFELSLGGTMNSIRGSKDYWELGTEGDQTSLSARNTAASSQLLTVMGEVRKGFPFGLELGGTFGHVIDTELWLVGFDLKWAFFEGGIEGAEWVPDMAVRAAARTLVGNPDFSLWSPSLELIVSKPLVVAGAWTLSPLMILGLAWVNADSALVDLTPEVNAYDQCVPDPAEPTTTCTNGAASGQDFNNQASFSKYRAERMRLTLGVEGRFSHFLLSAAFGFDLVAPNSLSAAAPSDTARQWNASLATGTVF